ncbi:hypothetical protein C6A85_06900, partial [Mycobacterium sp. ITM-2017-0098]
GRRATHGDETAVPGDESEDTASRDEGVGEAEDVLPGQDAEPDSESVSAAADDGPPAAADPADGAADDSSDTDADVAA